MKVILYNKKANHQVLDMETSKISNVSIIIYDGRYYVMRGFYNGEVYFEETEIPYVATERDYVKENVE
jgi:hypothetical protein